MSHLKGPRRALQGCVAGAYIDCHPSQTALLIQLVELPQKPFRGGNPFRRHFEAQNNDRMSDIWTINTTQAEF
eukprot:scaffold223937_cov51-Prasinocladus_malaysianus.AAC.1